MVFSTFSPLLSTDLRVCESLYQTGSNKKRTVCSDSSCSTSFSVSFHSVIHKAVSATILFTPNPDKMIILLGVLSF